jgi:hypothetical protein
VFIVLKETAAGSALSAMPSLETTNTLSHDFMKRKKASARMFMYWAAAAVKSAKADLIRKRVRVRKPAFRRGESLIRGIF